jgi:hypothetical protein
MYYKNNKIYDNLTHIFLNEEAKISRCEQFIHIASDLHDYEIPAFSFILQT